MGSKRSLLVDHQAGTLSVVVAGSKVHVTKPLAEMLERIVALRPANCAGDAPNVCLDKGYDNPTGRKTATDNCYRLHIRRTGEEKLAPHARKRYQPRWWLVERTLS